MLEFTLGFGLGLAAGLLTAFVVWRNLRREIDELNAILKTPIGKLVPGRRR